MNRQDSRRGFTLIEMATVMVILALLSSAVLFAMYQVQQQSKVARTHSQVAKIHEFIMERYESYQRRPLGIRLPSGFGAQRTAMTRLLATRDMMRMELPDRKTDIIDPPAALVIPISIQPLNTVTVRNTIPALWRAYRRRATTVMQEPPPWPSWTTQHQGAECLYLILSVMRAGDTTALDFFNEREIGDEDLDGMPEILDGFGRPIQFLRWAPGFVAHKGPDNEWEVAGNDDDNDGTTDNFTEAGWVGSDDIPSPSFLQSRTAQQAPDYFDPLKSDPRWQDNDPLNDLYALLPQAPGILLGRRVSAYSNRPPLGCCNSVAIP